MRVAVLFETREVDVACRLSEPSGKLRRVGDDDVDATGKNALGRDRAELLETGDVGFDRDCELLRFVANDTTFRPRAPIV